MQHPKSCLGPSVFPLPPSPSLATIVCFLSQCISLYFLVFSVDGIMSAHSFIWLFSLGVISLRFISVAACINSTFFFIAEEYFHCINLLFAYSFTSVFHCGAIAKQAAMSICVQVFIWVYTSFPLCKLPRSEMTASYGRCMFNILRHMAMLNSFC